MFENGLLRALSEEDRAAVVPALRRVEFHRGKVLEESAECANQACFIETGLASVVARSPQGEVGVGVIGYDGMTGTSILLGGGPPSNETRVHASGFALAIEASTLRRLLRERPRLNDLLLRYVQVCLTQASQNALCNSHARMEEKLARWILMSHDRFRGDDLTVTHEFISLMLGVRRQGITVAMHELEGEGLIKASRETIRVLDRDGLIARARGAYGICEAEYERLIGEWRPHGRGSSAGSGERGLELLVPAARDGRARSEILAGRNASETGGQDGSRRKPDRGANE